MRGAVIAAAVMICAAMPAVAGSRFYEVYGVSKDDMLKMRAGPDTGYRVIVGLPNGAEVRIYKCQSNGAVQWCKVSLREARGLVGWVSRSYLREK